MDKVQLEINNLTYSHSQSGAYVLELIEVDGNRSIPIVIGAYEAQSIALELEGMTPSRPLTHDLFKSLTDSFNIQLIEVVIDELVEGIFHSKLAFKLNNEIHQLDARTSDAIAIALRLKAPIYTLKNIIDSAGITREEYDEADKTASYENPDQQASNTPVSTFSNKTMEQLEELLNKAIEEENYEVASKIRDEINKRK